MPNFSLEKVQSTMYTRQHIRNMSVIAHVDHGKTTLTDALMARVGLIQEDQAGNKMATNVTKQEAKHGITIKSTGVSLFYDRTKCEEEVKEKGYLVNLIDSPGHVDFSSQVTAALRVTDGALVVVDYVQGVCVQTQTVLSQALAEKVKPVLLINKMDRGILEKQHDPDEVYETLQRIIESVNVLISTYGGDEMNWQIDPTQGNVAFGSGYFGWAFTIDSYAAMYAERLGIEKKSLMTKLWGNWYHDAPTKTWRTEPVSADGSRSLKRGFCEFVMGPIIKLTKAIMSGEETKIDKLLSKVAVELKKEERALEGKKLLKKVFSKWLNVGDTIFELIIKHLPSPVQAQPYRTTLLYTGPSDDEAAQAMKKCDPEGPLMVYISKMVPSSIAGQFFAFGRVYSGTVLSGEKVRIMNSNYEKPGDKTGLFVKPVQRCGFMMTGSFEKLSEVPSGNIVAIVGIDKFLVKQGTLTNLPSAYPIKAMKYSVSPVVRVAIRAVNPIDMPKLVQAMHRLSQSDPLLRCEENDNGELVMAGSGELHVETCVNDLKYEYLPDVPFTVGDPVVNYRETVTMESTVECLAKSSNKHVRIWAKAMPLGEELTKAIENEEITSGMDAKVRSRMLVERYNWDINDTKKIWSFGPDNAGPNVVVDQTKGIAYLNEIQDSVVSALQWVTREGVLTSEPLRGVRFNIIDAKIIADRAHRGTGQVLPAARRSFFASEMTAAPRIQEPIYLVEVQAPRSVLGSIYKVIGGRRGKIFQEEEIPGHPLLTIRAYLPVAESFGFNAELKSQTSGQAFPQCVFDHWKTMDSDPLEVGSKANQLVCSIRDRKKLKAGLPELSDYLDKL